MVSNDALTRACIAFKFFLCLLLSFIRSGSGLPAWPEGAGGACFGIIPAAHFLSLPLGEHFQFFLFRAFDPPLLHLRVRGYLPVRERTVEKEDVHTEQQHGESHEDDGGEEYFH